MMKCLCALISKFVIHGRRLTLIVKIPVLMGELLHALNQGDRDFANSHIWDQAGAVGFEWVILLDPTALAWFHMLIHVF